MSKRPPPTSSHFLLESLQLRFRSNQLSETAFRKVSREHTQPSPTVSVLGRAAQVYRPQLRQLTPSSFPLAHSDSCVSTKNDFEWAIRILLEERVSCGSSRSSWPQGHKLVLTPFLLHTHSLQGSWECQDKMIAGPLAHFHGFPTVVEGGFHEPPGHWAGSRPPTPHLSFRPGQLCP